MDPTDPDISAAFSAYNDPKRSMAERVGLRGYVPRSKEEADNALLDEFYKGTPTNEPAQTVTAEPESAPVTQKSNATNDNALLDEFYAEKPRQPASFAERFAAAPATPAPSGFERDAATAKSMPPVQAAQTILRRIVAEHPYMAGTVAAGINIPILAGVGLLAARAAPMLAPLGLTAIGAEKLYEYGKPLYDLVKP